MKVTRKNLAISITIICILAGLWLLSGFLNKMKNHKNDNILLSSQNASLTEKNIKLDSLIRLYRVADEYVILSRYDDAINLLKTGKNDFYDVADDISSKIALIEIFKSKDKSSMIQLQDVGLNKNVRIQQMEFLKDSLETLSKGIGKLNTMLAICREEKEALSIKLRTDSGGEDNRSEEDNYKIITIINSKGNEIYYLGMTSKGMANGSGAGLWKKGGHYSGMWKDNLRHGKGIYYWADGEHYEGEFKADKRDGIGTYTWQNGLYYIGSWKEDKRHGEGVLYEKNGNIRLKGVWNEDQFSKK